MKTQKIGTSALIVFLLLSLSAPLALGDYAEMFDVTLADTGNGTCRMWAQSPYGTGFTAWVSNHTISLPINWGVTFYAVPDDGYIFDYFSYVGYTSGNLSVQEFSTTIYSAFTLTAHFKVAASSTNVTLSDNTGGDQAIGYSKIRYGIEDYNFYQYPIVNIPEGTFIDVYAHPGMGYTVANVTIVGGTSAGIYDSGQYHISTTGLTSVTVVYVVGGDWSEYGTPAPNDFTWTGGLPDISTQVGLIKLIAYMIGLILSFIGLVVLMKASAAWMPGLLMIVIGLVLAMVSIPSLFALVGWSLTVLISPIFLYSGGKGDKR